MRDLIARFVRDETGTAAVEYGVLAALISVPLISAAKSAGLADQRHLQHDHRRHEAVAVIAECAAARLQRRWTAACSARGLTPWPRPG